MKVGITTDYMDKQRTGIGNYAKCLVQGLLDKGGASGLFKRQMLEEIEVFGDSFFAYYEDSELIWRAYKNGWKARYVPTSIVYHKGRGTSKKSKEFEHEMGFLCARNWARAVKRHGTSVQKFLFIQVLARTAAMSWVGMRIGRNVISAKPYIGAFKEFIRYKGTEKKK